VKKISDMIVLSQLLRTFEFGIHFKDYLP
jgi:hypothetical protein